ncbi:PH domain-containing protein [Streptomyces sp. NBC_01198]|uniref:PH domain-containing protein n=1 Tax=Streptomyces sp. NBC_01198 TaxID=2903769 RepID=UPI002E133775|nr:PH domain-containing protein [Streptomyces sp. NBC_01198]
MTTAGDDRALAAVAQLPVTFRPLVTRVVLLTMGTLLLGTLSTLAVVMPHEGASPWSSGDRITVVVVGVLSLALLTLLSRPKAVADAGGLTVVNLTVKRRLAWAEVLAVRLRAGDAWVHLDLADGTTLAVMGIQPGIARRQAVSDARRLRALVEALGEARDRDPRDGAGPG